jgi:hypothetical protein
MNNINNFPKEQSFYIFYYKIIFNIKQMALENQRRRGKSLPSKPNHQKDRACIFFKLLGKCYKGSMCPFTHEKIKKKYIPKPSMFKPQVSLSLHSDNKEQQSEVVRKLGRLRK